MTKRRLASAGLVAAGLFAVGGASVGPDAAYAGPSQGIGIAAVYAEDAAPVPMPTDSCHSAMMNAGKTRHPTS
jgi:glucokinase